MAKTITIAGQILYKDKTPIHGAKIKIWDMDKHTSDDLLVNDVSDRTGKFSGTGKWKDRKLDTAIFRYEVSFNGKKKTGKNIRAKTFFKKLQTGWFSPKQEAAKKKKKEKKVTISGHLLYKDKTSVAGARVRIWEMDKRTSDDVIVNVVTDANGRFTGTGVWNDGKLIDTPTFRYEVTLKGKEIARKNILDKKFFTKLQTGWHSPTQEKAIANKKLTIDGKLMFKDGTPMDNARIKIWEMDKKSADDLIVNVVTGKDGKFIGSGVWQDGGIIDKAMFRYEVTRKGKKISRKNIPNKLFFKKLKTNWFSPIEGIVTFKDKAPAQGARIKIWETDKLRPRDGDDLIVDKILDESGTFKGERLNERGIQTFRWEVTIPGTDFIEKSKHNKVPKFELNKIRLKSEIPGWKNWIDDFKTYIKPDNSFKPKTEDQLRKAIEAAVKKKLKIKVVGSGHSHSSVARPANLNAMIDLKGLSGMVKPYPWMKNSVLAQMKAKKIEGDLDDTIQSYVRVKAGTSLRTLYRKVLATRKLGLINMGPFDGQTIAGLVNTNTHGTGIKLPGFSDMVRSVEMFVIVPTSKTKNKVELWVIEPTDGISDPVKFKKKKDGRHLVQNDDVFNSVVCGYGLFGVAYSYTLAVRNFYWMNERNSPNNWKGVKKLLRDVDGNKVPKFLKQNHQVKLYINTAGCVKDRGLHDGIDVRVDKWNVMNRPGVKFPLNNYRLMPARYKSIHPIWPPMQKRKFDFQMKKIIEPGLTKYKLENKDKKELSILNFTLKQFFFSKSGLVKYNNKDKEDEYKGKFDSSAYYRVLRRGRDNNITKDKRLSKAQSDIDNTKPTADPVPQDYGPSIEICVPLNKTIVAIEELMKCISAGNKNGLSPSIGLNFVGPVGVRFTKKSDHLLAPAYGRDSAFIELAGLLPSKDFKNKQLAHGKDVKSDLRHSWPELVELYEAAFKQIFKKLQAKIPGITFHKGKYNDYNLTLLKRHYPKSFRKWQNMYNLFSSSGLLDCPNSEKWGIEKARKRLDKMTLSRKLQDLKQ